jgi:hypothetical protein
MANILFDQGGSSVFPAICLLIIERLNISYSRIRTLCAAWMNDTHGASFSRLFTEAASCQGVHVIVMLSILTFMSTPGPKLAES